MVAWQRSLFDPGDTVEAPTDLSDVRTTVLGDGAWVEYRPCWLPRPDLLFDHLAAVVPWRLEQREMYDRMVEVPRLVSFYEEGQDLPHPALGEIRQVLDRRYGGRGAGSLRTAGICLYRDGRDSVAWHGDRIGRVEDRDTLVAIVSIGIRRRFLLRPASGGRAIRYSVGEGDLLVMGGSCQRTWQHAVPKVAGPVGPRISIQFRS